MTIEIHAAVDPGRARSNNEDSVATDASRGVVVLADGMGGYNAGDVASVPCHLDFDSGARMLDWGAHSVDLCQWANQADETTPVDLAEMLDDAVDLAIRDQESAGIDVVSDGEMRRAGFFTAEFYRHLTGVTPLPSCRSRSFIRSTALAVSSPPEKSR